MSLSSMVAFYSAVLGELLEEGVCSRLISRA